MSTARDTRIEDFTYDLPDERIARYPLAVRDAAKLLHYKNGEIVDYHFTDLPKLLPYGTLLIGNATRVIHARLHFHTSNDKTIEIFCLDPVNPVDYQQTFAATDQVVWKCLVGGNRKWKSDFATLTVEIGGEEIILSARRLQQVDNAFHIEFSWPDARFSFGQLLDAAGNIPLPPYLNRAAEKEDKDRYQTVFAHTEGSVAAPTAGLHLSERLMEELKQQNMNWGEVILHVGAGTFKPVTSPTLGGHDMHAEYFEVDRLFLERLAAQLQSGQPIVSVGTTSTRCLESLYYIGSLLDQGKLHLGKEPVQLEQWVATDYVHSATPLAAIQAILHALRLQSSQFINGSTQLIITPGVRPKIVNGMITNFHQPASTLLLIVSAFTGHDWKNIYTHALANDYRFLSYGDGSLLWAE